MSEGITKIKKENKEEINMNTNIIKGIDEVIKGLTTIKGALMATDHAPIKEAVKEAIEEVLPNVIAEEEPAEEVKKVEKKSKVVEPEVEKAEEDTEVSGFDREAKKAELEEMKYNDLKALAGTLRGASAVGKKAEIIESILNAYEALRGAPSEEETAKGEEQEIQDEAEEYKDVADEQEDGEVDDREDFVEFLESLETDEVKEIAEQAGIKVGKKVVKAKLIEELVKDLDKLVEALEALGYYDEEDEGEGEDETVEAPEEVEEETGDEEDERVKIVEEYGLDEYTVEELSLIHI